VATTTQGPKIPLELLPQIRTNIGAEKTYDDQGTQTQPRGQDLRLPKRPRVPRHCPSIPTSSVSFADTGRASAEPSVPMDRILTRGRGPLKEQSAHHIMSLIHRMTW